MRANLWRRIETAVRSVALGAAVVSSASAMTFHAEPPNLFVGGSVVRSDWDAWEESMIRFDGKIETIVFHNSGGGDSLAGRKIGEDIRARKLSTVVLGRCSSACANMFLGGVARQFAAAQADTHTVLGYHGSYNKKTKALNKNKAPDYFLAMTDGKMSEAFVERFIRLENNRGLMRFAHRDQRATAEPLAMLCKGDETRVKGDKQRNEQCEKLDGVDALLQGVITTWDTRVVSVPPTPSRDKATIKTWTVTKAASEPKTEPKTEMESAAKSAASPIDPLAP